MDATHTNTKSTRRLGKGLSGLVRGPVGVAPPSLEQPAIETPRARGAEQATHAPHESPAPSGGAERLTRVSVTAITPNPRQPRRAIDEASLVSLAASIRANGVVQPIALRPRTRSGDRAGEPAYEIIAGERRWRAAMLAGLTDVPAVIVGLDDRASAEWALVENIQREDLNPIDCAHALHALHDRFGLTQAQIAERVGMERPTVANLLRLTELEAPVQEMVVATALSLGHAKVLLGAPAGDRRVSLARRCAQGGWSVRRLEALVKAPGQFADPLRGAPGLAGTLGSSAADSGAAHELTRAQAAAKDLERRLADHLGTRVRLRTDATGKRGRIVVEFFDLDQLEGVLKRMGLDGA